MDGSAIVTVSGTVVALVQLLKWSGLLRDGWAPYAVLGASVLGVACWGVQYGAGDGPFDYLAAVVAVMTSAAGVFGFVRQAATTLTSLSK